MIAYKLVSMDFKSYMLKYASGASIENNYYIINYKLNVKIYKKKNTIGIFCFKTIKNALKFFKGMDIKGRLLKIEGIGEPTNPIEISPGLNQHCIDEFYEKNDLIIYPSAFEGTICFDSIKPLKDISDLLPDVLTIKLYN